MSCIVESGNVVFSKKMSTENCFSKCCTSRDVFQFQIICYIRVLRYDLNSMNDREELRGRKTHKCRKTMDESDSEYLENESKGEGDSESAMNSTKSTTSKEGRASEGPSRLFEEEKKDDDAEMTDIPTHVETVDDNNKAESKEECSTTQEEPKGQKEEGVDTSGEAKEGKSGDGGKAVISDNGSKTNENGSKTSDSIACQDWC